MNKDPDEKHVFFIRDASEHDLELLLAAENEIFQNPWNIDHLKSELYSLNSMIRIVESDGHFAGYIIATKCIDTYEIYRIGILTRFRQSGLASRLINDISSTAVESGADRIILEVNSQNTKAISLYLKNGFIKIHERKNYYNNESADIMEKSLK